MTDGLPRRPVPRAARHLILAELHGVLYQLFSITFGKTGIFVHFPYHPDTPGAACRAPADPRGAVAVNLDRVTSTTTQHVKYSHHVDGGCHFSQDGKIVTTIISHARPLNEDIPYMFTIDIQGVERFEPLPKAKTRYRPSRFTLDGYREHPRLHIVTRWFARPSALVSTLNNPGGHRGGRRRACRRPGNRRS